MFAAGVATLVTRYAKLNAAGRRESASAKHSSLTFTLEADSAEQIIDIYRSISELPDLVVAL